MKLFIIVCVVLLLGGCATVHPPKVEYNLSSKAQSKGFRSSGCATTSLKVAEAFSVGTLMSLNMNYVQGANKQFSYSQAQWAISPNQAITAKLLELVRETNLFRNVQVSKSRSKNDWILEASIEDFMQYFSEDLSESHARAVITLTFIDANTNSVLATKTFTAKVGAKTLDADGGVEALDRALLELLTQIDIWFTEVCK